MAISVCLLPENPLEERVRNRVVEKQEAGSILRTFLDEHYYPWCQVHQKVPERTRQILEYNFSSFMNKWMGSITKANLDGWSRKKLSDGIKPSTINRASSAFTAIFNKALKWEIIDANPIARRKRLKIDKRGVVRWLSEEEESRVMEALKSSESEYIKLLVPPPPQYRSETL